MEKSFPTVLLVFGATGDLMGKKIIPALWYLFQKEKLPDGFEIVGLSRRDMTDADFRAFIEEWLNAHVQTLFEKSECDRFLELFSFKRLTFESDADFEALAKYLDEKDAARGPANRLLYMATPPDAFPAIFGHGAFGKIVKHGEAHGTHTRVIVEKPFGTDAASAEALEAVLAARFSEEQLYRADHYLAKYMLQNIMHFRFRNNMFENIWNREHVASITIRTLEPLSIDKRGAFYDPLGALRDVGQNHLLEMLALVTMEKPGTMDAGGIQKARAEAIMNLHLFSEEEAARFTFRAQHEGYRAIPGVMPDSNTETYYRLLASIDTPRWSGVPVIMEAGKRLSSWRTEIVVDFRNGTNRVAFRVRPEEEMLFHFESKKPGVLAEGDEGRTFAFTLDEGEKNPQYVAEYSEILMAAARGDRSLFVSREEIRAEWRFIDPIIAAWKKNLPPLAFYAPDTDEPLRMADAYFAKAPTLKKEIGIVGLGKMGGNLARRLMEKGWEVLGYDRSGELLKTLEAEGLRGAAGYKEMAAALPSPRIIWLMVPAAAVDETLFGAGGFAEILSPGDILIDGGNSFYKEAVERSKKLKEKGIRYLDAGTSGGPSGARNGACLMIGGEREAFEKTESLFADLAREDGYRFFEGAGAGHFVKMVHNGIEYGMMQAIAEGFEILKKSSYDLDLTKVAEIYNRGSVVESRLTEWLEGALKLHGQELKDISSTVAHTGEGAWTVETGKEMGIEARVIADALQFRIDSEKNPRYAGKVLSALRGAFGGHATK